MRRGHVVALLVILGLNFVGLTFQTRAKSDLPVRVAFTTVFGSAQQLLASARRTTGAWVDSLRDIEEVHGERETLRARLARTEWELTVARGQLARARGMTELDWEALALGEPVAAEIVGVSASPLDRTVTLNRGSAHGVSRNGPVMAGSGLMGRVVQVSRRFSQVELITSASAGVAALTVESRARGLLRGGRTRSADGATELTLDYVSVGQAVQVGELVIASGLDRLYPKGLVVGRVARVRWGTGLLLEVGVAPAVDFDRVERVFVLPPETDPSLIDP